MSLLANSNAIESGGYNIDRSLRFRSSASAYLNRTPASASNRKTWTWSGWVKRGALGVERGIFSVGASAANFALFFHSSDQLRVWTNGGNASIYTNAVYRDPSAWYHIILQSSSISPYFNLYVNGVQVTSFAYDNRTTYPGSSDTEVNSTDTHRLAGWYNGSIQTCDCYLAEVNFIDGQALTPSSFGETSTETGVWVPKKYIGTYGTNGFYLPFSDNTSATTLAYDKSGNGNNWTANNISTTAGATYDSMTDVPTLTSATAANFATWNPLSSSNAYLSGGNLNLSVSSGTTWYNQNSSIGVSSGKWYCEINVTNVGNTVYGITRNPLPTGFTSGDGYFCDAFSNGYGGMSTPSSNIFNGDVIGYLLNFDTNTFTIYRNNASICSASISAGTYFMYHSANFNTSATANTSVNFGQRPFSYTPPTGFKALNTFNLPDPTIKKPNQYMDATLYSGTSASQSVTNAGSFQPDLVWIKSRSAATDHKLTDSVRGVTKALISDTTGAETTDTNGLTAFNSNGFTVGSDSVYNNGTGPATYVGWQWKKGATPGFDIVTYTGTGANQSINHSLGVAPKFMIVKSRNAVDWWPVYHASLGATQNLRLNGTNAVETLSNIWNNTAPTASQFTIGTSTETGGNGTTYVAYLFAEIAGFSAFGSYTGNGSTDGPFVYCGFRPKYVLVKASSAVNDWVVLDTSRDPYNAAMHTLYPDLSNAEEAPASGVTGIDIVSNGFKIRDAKSFWNQSSQTFIFAAFAENPMKYSLAR